MGDLHAGRGDVHQSGGFRFPTGQDFRRAGFLRCRAEDGLILFAQVLPHLSGHTQADGIIGAVPEGQKALCQMKAFGTDGVRGVLLSVQSPLLQGGKQSAPVLRGDGVRPQRPKEGHLCAVRRNADAQLHAVHRREDRAHVICQLPESVFAQGQRFRATGANQIKNSVLSGAVEQNFIHAVQTAGENPGHGHYRQPVDIALHIRQRVQIQIGFPRKEVFHALLNITAGKLLVRVEPHFVTPFRALFHEFFECISGCLPDGIAGGGDIHAQFPASPSSQTGQHAVRAAAGQQ